MVVRRPDVREVPLGLVLVYLEAVEVHVGIKRLINLLVRGEARDEQVAELRARPGRIVVVDGDFPLDPTAAQVCALRVPALAEAPAVLPRLPREIRLGVAMCAQDGREDVLLAAFRRERLTPHDKLVLPSVGFRVLFRAHAESGRAAVRQDLGKVVDPPELRRVLELSVRECADVRAGERSHSDPYPQCP